MLRESQKLTVEVAVRRARENGTEAEEIRKLAVEMNVSEEAIRAYANSILAPEAGKVNSSVPKASIEKPEKGRSEWSEEQIQKLTGLHSQGMGPSAIAKSLGCDVKRVQAKLYNLKKSGQLIQNSDISKFSSQGAQSKPKAEVSQKVEGIPAQTLSEVVIDPESKIKNSPVPIRIASEIMQLARKFESNGAVIGRIQINEVAGWGCVSFDMPEGPYRVSIHRRKSK